MDRTAYDIFVKWDDVYYDDYQHVLSYSHASHCDARLYKLSTNWRKHSRTYDKQLSSANNEFHHYKCNSYWLSHAPNNNDYYLYHRH